MGDYEKMKYLQTEKIKLLAEIQKYPAEKIETALRRIGLEDKFTQNIFGLALTINALRKI